MLVRLLAHVRPLAVLLACALVASGAVARTPVAVPVAAAEEMPCPHHGEGAMQVPDLADEGAACIDLCCAACFQIMLPEGPAATGATGCPVDRTVLSPARDHDRELHDPPPRAAG